MVVGLRAPLGDPVHRMSQEVIVRADVATEGVPHHPPVQDSFVGERPHQVEEEVDVEILDLLGGIFGQQLRGEQTPSRDHGRRLELTPQVEDRGGGANPPSLAHLPVGERQGPHDENPCSDDRRPRGEVPEGHARGMSGWFKAGEGSDARGDSRAGRASRSRAFTRFGPNLEFRGESGRSPQTKARIRLPNLEVDLSGDRLPRSWAPGTVADAWRESSSPLPKGGTESGP